MTLETAVVIGILIVEVIDFCCTRWEWRQEFEFDRDIYEKKRRTKTTKKTTTDKAGSVTTEETNEVIEPIKSIDQVRQITKDLQEKNK